MKHPKLMTAILNDGSQITGSEIAQTMHADKVILANDEQEVSIDLSLCISYEKAIDPVYFDELTPIEAAEIEKLTNLSSFLIHQAY
jgi:uncharacterized alkaline shock family protein YloU